MYIGLKFRSSIDGESTLLTLKLLPCANAESGTLRSSWLITTAEYLLQCGFVSSCDFLPGEAKNLCVPEPRPRACRRENLLGRLNHASQDVLQKRIGEGNLHVYQCEERLYLLRHICEGGRNTGFEVICCLGLVASPDFVFTGR
jgi:hypothetical protein